MKKLLLSACICMFISFISNAQSSVRGYAGLGYGIENRIGFHGVVAQGGAEFFFNNHLTGIVGADFFYARQVPKWGKLENEGAFYRQITPSVRFQYSTGEDAGTGLLLSAGMGIRTGKTYHFQSGDFHNGSFTNQRYVSEHITGKGFILGIGYGFYMGEKLLGKIEFNNHAFLKLNEQYLLSFKVSF